jgi:hypothetical protein
MQSSDLPKFGQPDHREPIGDRFVRNAASRTIAHRTLWGTFCGTPEPPLPADRLAQVPLLAPGFLPLRLFHHSTRAIRRDGHGVLAEAAQNVQG